MNTETKEPEVVEIVPSSALEAQTRGEVDIQVATARRYPRSLVAFKKSALEMATLDEDTADACIYALPRDGKTIEGPSARLAEILASAYGHMRVEGRTLEDDGAFIRAQGRAWDLQNNVAIAFETQRRVTDKNGKRFKDDMIAMTANAATSIALRNAILKVIPKAFWGPIYEACRSVAVGSASTLADRRAKMLQHFQKMGVTPERVFALLAVKGVEDITLDHMAILKGLATAIKEGDTTVDQAFSGEQAGPLQPAQRKSQQTNGNPKKPADTQGAEPGSASPASTTPASVVTTKSEPASPSIGVVVLIVPQPAGTVAKLDTGFQCATKDPALVAALESLRRSGRRVELVTKAQRDPKWLPVLVEIQPIDEAAK